MKKVRILADARREFYKEIAYYEKERQGLGKRFRRAAEATFLNAGANPEHGKPGVGGTRRLLVKGFPFSVVYLESAYEGSMIDSLPPPDTVLASVVQDQTSLESRPSVQDQTSLDKTPSATNSYFVLYFAHGLARSRPVFDCKITTH